MSASMGRVFADTGLAAERPWWQAGTTFSLADRLDSYIRREIAAQPDLLRRTDIGLRGIVLPAVVRGADRLLVVAAGSALRAATAARGWIEQISGLPCDVAPPGDASPPGGTAVVLVARPGQAAGMPAAVADWRARGIATVALVDAPEVSRACGADLCWPIEAGTERGAAATKSFTVQLLALLRLGVALGAARGTLDADAMQRAERALGDAPLAAALAEAAEARLATLGARIARAGEAVVIGHGWGAALAGEAALMLSQFAGIRADAVSGGRAGLEKLRAGVPVLLLAGADQTLAETVACAEDAGRHGGQVIVLAEAACSTSFGKFAGEVVALPGRGPAQMFAQAVATQLVACHTALALGLDVDQPRSQA